MPVIYRDDNRSQAQRVQDRLKARDQGRNQSHSHDYQYL
jgi:hypothetical protein